MNIPIVEDVDSGTPIQRTAGRPWMEWAQEAALLALLSLSAWRFSLGGGSAWRISALVLLALIATLVIHFVTGYRSAPLPQAVVAVAVAFVSSHSNSLAVLWTVPASGGLVIVPSVPMLAVIAACWAIDNSRLSSLERALVVATAGILIFTITTTLLLLSRGLVDPRTNVIQMGTLLMLALLLRGALATGKTVTGYRRLCLYTSIVLIIGLVRGQF